MIKVDPCGVVDALRAILDKNDCYSTDSDEDLYESIMAQRNKFALKTKDGDILAIIGFSFLREGVVQGWALTTQKGTEHSIGLSKAMRRILDFSIIDMNAHRVEIVVRADFPKGHEWAEFLGFERESVLKMYNSDKTDSVLYRRIT